MKRLNGYRKRLVFVGIVAAMVGGRLAKADFIFGEPTNLGPTVNSTYTDGPGAVSPDGLELYIGSARPPGTEGSFDIWVSTRITVEDSWGEPVRLPIALNTSRDDWVECMSADGLELYGESGGPSLSSNWDIWVAKRPTKDDPWADRTDLQPPINSLAADWIGSISTDGLELYLSSTRPGGYGNHDLYVAKRETANDAWGTPVNLGMLVNSSYFDGNPVILPDGLSLYFSSQRPGGYGGSDIWATKRVTREDHWGAPVNLGPRINTNAEEDIPKLSYDATALYIGSNRPGEFGSTYGPDVWQVPIVTIVDLNGDGVVDGSDMCTIVEHWGENYSLCDIGPTPCGDGIVNVDDLKVLAEHLFEEVDDPTLVAHWPLDETEGMVIHDTVGDNQAFAVGDPVWQPDGGQVGGALLFDGVDDFISAPMPLNPADGPFSVLVWVQGGAPGQGIMSEADGPCWLSLDLSAGHLMTELASAGRSAAPLISQTAINDGTWHRVALVWDGSNRILCVDEAIVAQDAQDGLDSTGNGLYIGCGDPLQPSTFFSGLIDDIRIYNRAVKP